MVQVDPRTLEVVNSAITPRSSAAQGALRPPEALAVNVMTSECVRFPLAAVLDWARPQNLPVVG